MSGCELCNGKVVTCSSNWARCMLGGSNHAPGTESSSVCHSFRYHRRVLYFCRWAAWYNDSCQYRLGKRAIDIGSVDNVVSPGGWSINLTLYHARLCKIASPNTPKYSIEWRRWQVPVPTPHTHTSRKRSRLVRRAAAIDVKLSDCVIPNLLTTVH